MKKKSLDQIFNYYETDKGSLAGDRHNYSAVYAALFEPFRLDNFKMLEVGVLNGASLDSWLEYFPNAEIFAADKEYQPSFERFKENSRVTIFEGSGQDPKVVNEEGFRIIIDDADHALSTQIELLSSLWPKLSAGGYYIIEDLFVGEVPWSDRLACNPKQRAYLQYKGHFNSTDESYIPKHPHDINFLSHIDLPNTIKVILNNNQHFFTISAVGKAGGLHMMLVITKNKH